MSEGKVVGGGASLLLGGAVAATALLTVGAIAGAASLIKLSYEKIKDEVEKERVAKRLQELAALEHYILNGQKAAEKFKEQVDKWELEATCKSLEKQLLRHKERIQKASLIELPAISPPSGNTNEILKEEVIRLQNELTNQETALRKAITKALEGHHAAKGVVDSIERLAELPAPLLETPLSLLNYAQEIAEIQMHRENTNAISAFSGTITSELEKLRNKDISKKILGEIKELVEEFNHARQKSEAQVIYLKIIKKIADAISISKAQEPLRERLKSARAMARDLLHKPQGDEIKLLFDEYDELEESKILAVEQSLKAAKARDEQWIREQQQKLMREATLCALINLGYQTSANMNDTMWSRNGSLFFTRPEWGSHIVSLRYDQNKGNMIFSVGCMIDEGIKNTPLASETKKMISAWCETRLPILLAELKKQNIQLSVIEELNFGGTAIQKINSHEFDTKLADQIRGNINNASGHKDKKYLASKEI